MRSSESWVLLAPLGMMSGIGLAAGGGHAVVAGDASGWPWLVAGLVAGALAASGIRRLVAESGGQDHSASRGDAALTPPDPRALRRGAWSLGAITLLWAVATSLVAALLPWSARTGSASFGILVAVVALAAFFAMTSAVALRRILRGIRSAARWGFVSAVFLALWALAYVGDDWAGGSDVRAAVGVAVAVVAGGLALVLDRMERSARGACGDADGRRD